MKPGMNPSLNIFNGSFNTTVASTPSGSIVSHIRAPKKVPAFPTNIVKPNRAIDVAQQKSVMEKYGLPEIW